MYNKYSSSKFTPRPRVKWVNLGHFCGKQREIKGPLMSICVFKYRNLKVQLLRQHWVHFVRAMCCKDWTRNGSLCKLLHVLTNRTSSILSILCVHLHVGAGLLQLYNIYFTPLVQCTCTSMYMHLTKTFTHIK